MDFTHLKMRLLVDGALKTEAESSAISGNPVESLVQPVGGLAHSIGPAGLHGTRDYWLSGDTQRACHFGQPPVERREREHTRSLGIRQEDTVGEVGPRRSVADQCCSHLGGALEHEVGASEDLLNDGAEVAPRQAVCVGEDPDRLDERDLRHIEGPPLGDAALGRAELSRVVRHQQTHQDIRVSGGHSWPRR